ncbi:hypothetical protein EBB54_15495 [Schaedlerella arabinosiphila]|jgi:hypothetical protein|uniref:Uncharacterized protein n=1 Tax=Schaedlerella arabinosiphila TaxID=2044587 RepID=A0A3R8LZH0_9FIRM|nr:hypothetical protein [Schaedlerella arabinosiphila]MCI8748638.1 hypothetical protein [Lachnospiraceae bacterium]RRK32603.1 hypothetical protein EBB54_15495 [Schaedlerella arabinosiphila]
MRANVTEENIKMGDGMIGWEYYNHAAIPTCAPHEIPNLKLIENGSIWKIRGGIPLLARWTTEWDCGYETNWWYVIKDNPFQMEDVKSKIRTQIRKGIKNFQCEEIRAKEYAEEIYQVLIKANSSYEKQFVKNYNKEKTIKSIAGWPDEIRVWGAFNAEKQLCAYTSVADKDTFFKIISHKSSPESERYQVNLAILFKVLQDLNSEIGKGKYICNGERTINHKTNFNEYFEKYFHFRKSYCKLNLRYRKGIGIIVSILYPVRKRLEHYSYFRLIQSLNAVMYMNAIMKGDQI